MPLRRSAAYRSFVTCADPKGVADCNPRRTRKSKIQGGAAMEVSNSVANRRRVTEASRDCYDELREVIRENFARQNLNCGGRKDFIDLCAVDLLPSSSTSSIRAASYDDCSPTEVLRVGKPKPGNLIAKLMGLDEFVLPEKMSSNHRSRLLDIDLLSRPRSVVHKVVEETEQFKGLVSGREGKCLYDLSFLRKVLAVEGRPPIVVMRPRRRDPHFHSRNEGNTIKSRSQMPSREVVPKGRVMVTEPNEKFRVERINKEKVDKLPTKKTNHPKTLVPRVHENETVAKRIDVSTKLGSNTRKNAGIKDGKTRDQGKTTTLKLIRRNTKDSNVANCQKANPEKKKKPTLSLSGIPKKNLRKSKPHRKPASDSVENIQNDGSLSINIERSITHDQYLTMNSCYISTSDDSANDMKCVEDDSANDMKCVEDVTCITGSPIDDKKSWESIYNMRRVLLNSPSFLCLVEEQFDVGTCDAKILRTPSLHNSEMPDDSLLLDCAIEIMERKGTLRFPWALNPLSQNLLESPKRRLSLRQLMGEIADVIEVLTNYNKSCDGADRIYSMLERDVWLNEEVTGGWDLGWKTGNATEDVNRVVHDLEELVLREIIADVVIEYMFG